MSKAPTLSKRAQRRLSKAPEQAVAQWNRDEDAFAFVVESEAAHSYVRQQEYWSTWTLTNDEGESVRSREHVKSARHWEDQQCAKAAEPVGYWLTKADGTSEWIEPPSSSKQQEAATKASHVAAEQRRKGATKMTGAERVRLSRWRSKAASKGWTCTEHRATDLVDCSLECKAVFDTEQAATSRKAASHGL